MERPINRPREKRRGTQERKSGTISNARSAEWLQATQQEKHENAKPQGPNHSQPGSRSRQKQEQGSIPANISEMGRSPVDATLVTNTHHSCMTRKAGWIRLDFFFSLHDIAIWFLTGFSAASRRAMTPDEVVQATNG